MYNFVNKLAKQVPLNAELEINETPIVVMGDDEVKEQGKKKQKISRGEELER